MTNIINKAIIIPPGRHMTMIHIITEYNMTDNTTNIRYVRTQAEAMDYVEARVYSDQLCGRDNYAYTITAGITLGETGTTHTH